jgi:flagellar motor switch protein FliN
MTVLPCDKSEGATGMLADAAQAKAPGGSAMGLLLDMEMPMVVRFGATRMPLRDVLQLAPGSVVDLDPAPEDSVELLVNGKVVARGVAVTVRGNYGVRISEIAPAGAGFDPGTGTGLAGERE